MTRALALVLLALALPARAAAPTTQPPPRAVLLFTGDNGGELAPCG